MLGVFFTPVLYVAMQRLKKTDLKDITQLGPTEAQSGGAG